MTTSDAKFLALSLLYGPPRPRWGVDNGFFYNSGAEPEERFRAAVDKVFTPSEVARVGRSRLAYDYAEWYFMQEKALEANK